MTITFSCNGYPVIIQPNTKLLIGSFVIFACGIFFLVLLGCATLVGIGLVLWHAGVLLYHLLQAVFATNLLIQGLALLILLFVLLCLAIFFLKYIWSALPRSAKPLQGGAAS
jgi:hypothetical protein